MSWFKRNWKFFVILGGGLAGIAVLTLFILSQREERGFMVRECRAGEGVTAQTRWSKADLPVPVWLSVEDTSLGPDIEEAIDYWKPYLKWGGLLTAHQKVSDPVILVESFPAPDPLHGSAKLRWIGDCRIRRVEVKIPLPMMEGRMRTCVVRHELGHALGLDHDDDEDSVMKGVRGARFDCDITEHDQALLKEAYEP